MNIIYRVVGLLLLAFFAFSDIAFPIRLAGFIITYTAISGIEIGTAKEYGYKQGKEENIGRSVKFEKLEPGSYLFSTSLTQEEDCSLTGNCGQYHFFLWCNTGMIPVRIIAPEIGKIERAMGKSISRIRKGERFEIDKNHNITKIET